MSVLLDSSVAVALLADDHEDYQASRVWLFALAEPFATCPITQGAAVHSAARALASVIDPDRHEFWPDDIGYPDVRFEGVIGHRQVTDAYLAQLARHRGGRVATLDRAMAAQHPDVAELVPTS